MIKLLIGVVIASVIVIVSFLLIDPRNNTTNVNEVAEVSSINGSKYSIEGEINNFSD